MNPRLDLARHGSQSTRPVSLSAGVDESGDPRTGPPALGDAGVVHDLGNLIQIASSAISIIGRSDIAGTARVAQAVAGARTSLEQAGALVRRALGHARGLAGSGEAANVGLCLAEVETLARASDAGLLVHVRLGPGLPAAACDANGLKSAVLNLVFNARDAMAGKGLVSIVAARTSHAGAAAVEIRISDTGVGMSPETVSRAFDPFFTTKPDGLGGVGLPMVERFAREAGGAVSIDSQQGTGTTVILRLPGTSVPSRFISEESV